MKMEVDKYYVRFVNGIIAGIGKRVIADKNFEKSDQEILDEVISQLCDEIAGGDKEEWNKILPELIERFNRDLRGTSIS